MEYAAKPTKFDGVVFRSRLEAKWAAFFNMCGWRWEYEPFDLERWTPDFVLRGPARNVLVEVKPIAWVDSEWSESESWADYYANPTSLHGQCRARRDLDKTVGYDVLVLGAYLPVIKQNLNQMALIGVARSAKGEAWGSDLVSVHQAKSGKACLHGVFQGAWLDLFQKPPMIEIDEDGREMCAVEEPARKATISELNAAWKEAGVKVQWRPAS